MTVPDDHVAHAIADFFAPPTATEPFGVVSTLHLLRREIQDCYVGRIVEREENLLAEPERHRLFATAMVVFAGFDLLAKFVTYGSGRGAGEAFVHYVTRFGTNLGEVISEIEANMLWSFRNALIHSFGLHHEAPGGTLVHLFIYEQNAPAPVIKRVDLRSDDDDNRSEGWELSLDDLVELLLLSLRRYRTELDTDETLRESFMPAFQKFGTLHHRGPHFARH